MNIDYGMLMTEQCIEEIGLVGKNSAIGAGMGAGVGAAATGGVWAAKRLMLRKKIKKCDDLSSLEAVKTCKEKVKSEIKELRNKSLKRGVVNTALGAGIGAAAGSVHGHNRLSNFSKYAGTEIDPVAHINAAKKAGQVAIGLGAGGAVGKVGSIIAGNKKARKKRAQEENVINNDGIKLAEDIFQEFIGIAAGAASGHLSSAKNKKYLEKLQNSKAACGKDPSCSKRYDELIKQFKSKVDDRSSSMTRRGIGGALTGTVGVGMHYAYDNHKKKIQMRNIVDKLKYQQTQCKDDTCREKLQKQIGIMKDKYGHVK